MATYEMSATMQAETATPDDGTLSTAVKVKMKVSFSAKQPKVSYTAKRS